MGQWSCGLESTLQCSNTPTLRFVCSHFMLNLDGNIHTGGQVEFFELVHRLGGRLNDVNQALVRALFEGFLRFFVRVRRALNGEALDASRQRDGSGDARPGAFDGVGDVAGGLVNDPMVKGLQSNANALSSHTKNNFIVMVLLKISPFSGTGRRNI